ncbi:hypothetical protein VP1G_10584 [Cytospora mali]|uniref:Uncharacterized protein n=1 Tax=Cytospora mali TaxID=578113 RepID=A0A194UPQ9_CYTMA|nr:hypothetical protein VP1G_10584 [Valsa mali var. pyri (nom. inval.)]
MSASTRNPTHGANRGSNGGAAGEKISSRMPRINTDNTSRSPFEPRTQKSGIASPRLGQDRPPHKRTLSGNPRTNSMRAAEERERRTEKHTVTTRETIVSRTKSPGRGHMASMSTDRAKGPDRRGADTRSKDLRQEAPLQGMNWPLMT